MTGRLATWIVIPAYNEGGTIGQIVAACRDFAFGPIVVDDGSSDRTAEIAAASGATVLRNVGNLGKGASLWRGMQAALAEGAELVVTLDGDGQHRPADIPALLARSLMCPGAIVIGSRRGGKAAAPRARVIANRIADFWVSWAAHHRVEDSQSGFRVYPASVLRRIGERRMTRGFAFESEILIEAGRAGVLTVAVDIPAIYGETLQRESHFRPVADIARIVCMVAGKLLRRGLDPVGLWRALHFGGEDVDRRVEPGDDERKGDAC